MLLPTRPYEMLQNLGQGWVLPTREPSLSKGLTLFPTKATNRSKKVPQRKVKTAARLL